VTDLARLSQLVDRRDDDLLVAADERITPHEEYFDNWTYFLDVHQSQLETEQCQSLYVHFERQYRNIRDEALSDDRVDDFCRAAGPGLRNVGVAAATGDVQWAVSRATEQLLDLAVRSGRTPDRYLSDVEQLVDAGGRDGVQDAIHRLRARVEAEQGHWDPSTQEIVSDPITDQLPDSNEQDPDRYQRPIRTETLSDDSVRFLDAVETFLSDTTGRHAVE
jgi:hypothetical protein